MAIEEVRNYKKWRKIQNSYITNKWLIIMNLKQFTKIYYRKKKILLNRENIYVHLPRIILFFDFPPYYIVDLYKAK